MKAKISVVIVCKNEAHIIGRTLKSVLRFADELLVYDTGSTDATIAIATAAGATVVHRTWEGYGKSKQSAVALARNHWVLNLDADEVVDDVLQNNISQLPLTNEKICYRFQFKNFLGGAVLRWGEFGFDSHIRLFNRLQVNWNDAPVHEQLQFAAGVKKQTVAGFILHYTMQNTAEFVQKTVQYALVNAESYFARGRKATWVKLYLSPAATFVKYYVLRLGLLDGGAGLFAARMAALYSYVKYVRLQELWEEGKPPTP